MLFYQISPLASLGRNDGIVARLAKCGTIGSLNTVFRRLSAGNQLRKLIAVFFEPFCFSADHQQKIGAVEVAEEAGSGDWQNRLGDHRLDHQIDQGLQLIFIQEGRFSNRPFFVAVKELQEFVLVEIIWPVGGIRPAADNGELQHAVGKIDYGGGDPDRIEIEHDGDLVFGKEHIARMPVAVDDLGRPGIEAQLVYPDARFVIENRQCLSGGLQFAAGLGRSVGADGP